MSYQEILIDGFIDDVKENSEGPHPKKFCFVLGAGASKTSGIKTGQELVDIWEEDLLRKYGDTHQKWKDELRITDKNKYNFYSKYYERRFKRHEGYNYLEKMMEQAKPGIGYVMLSYLLVHTNNNVVITTNFDHLIEDAVNYYEQHIPLVIGHETLTPYVGKEPFTRPTIVKIHRDLLFDPQNTTDEVRKLHNNWKKPLEKIFSEYYPIFIGYAGNDDSLMDFLIDNSVKFASEEWTFPYWMVYKSETMGGKVQKFIQKAGGYLIRHNGFDEVMYRLGAEFGYRLQKEEDFLKDARRRYYELVSFVDRFAEESEKAKTEIATKSDNLDSIPENLGLEKAIEKITAQAEKCQRLYSEAVALHIRGEYKQAIRIKKELIGLKPDSALYHNSLGVTLHMIEQYEEAEQEKRKAVELEPDNAQYHSSLGVTLHVMQRYEEAEQEKRKAVELEPDNALYHNNLGATLHAMERYDESEREKREAVKLEPDNALYHDNLSATLHARGEFEEAEKEMRKAVELEPDNAQYYNNLGAALHAMKQYKDAEMKKRKAVELEPNNAFYYYSLGITLYAAGKFEEAEQEIRKAIELEPNNVQYHSSLEMILHTIQCFKEDE